MRKILNLLVLFAFLSQQIAWATHLPWCPDFESSSVLPYHISGDGRAWVLLSKKTYKAKEYDAPEWGDFGGKVEDKDIGNAARAAARELEEESEGQITTTEAELLSGPFHQMDMNKSPFGEGVRRHTIFFKRMDSMPELKVAEGIDKGPTGDGKCEVSQYQWVLANDLLKMDVPALFGSVLGLYTPGALKISALTESAKNEFFSVPFFVLLQQTNVRNILSRYLQAGAQRSIAHFSGGASSLAAAAVSVSVSHASTYTQKTFSQIVFTGGGFQDWRLVHSDYLSPASAIPAIPDDFDERLILEQFAIRTVISNATRPKRTLEQVLAFDPEARQVHEVPATMPVVQLRLLHKPKAKPGLYPFAPSSPNFWNLDSLKNVPNFSRTRAGKDVSSIEDAAAFMQVCTYRTQYLEQLKLGKVPALRIPSPRKLSANYVVAIRKQGRGDEPGILVPKSEEEITRYSNGVRMLKEIAMKKEYAVVKAPIPFERLPVMTDAQLIHLLGGMPPSMPELLGAYQTRVKVMRPHTKEVDTITHPTFVKAVDGVLRAERAHPELFTAYHGCAAEVHFLQTVYSALGHILGLPRRTVNWRLFDRSFQRYGRVSSAFSDTCQSVNQDNEFVNAFELLVAGNAALTGNPEHDGCRTLTYWKKSHSEVPLDLKHVLGDVFVGLGLDPRLAVELAGSLYREYEKLYYVDDPEQTESVGSVSAATTSVSASASTIRRIGVLRQIFVAPQAVDESLALSGWFFDTPLSFADRTLPNRTVVSIYDGLETDANAWMRQLPDALRFMTHIRAGHSIPMDANIKRYHAIAPNGLRPFTLLDYEVRLLTGKDPALVQTHYYPPSPGDTTREQTVADTTLAIVKGSLDGAELPIRSFHDFNTKHNMLRLMMQNQLSIFVVPAPVSLQQFKAAVAQGDLEAMEVYLSNPDHQKTFEEVDIISGKPRFFTVADYMVMVAVRHNMAARTISTAVEKYKILRGTHPTQSPFALFGLLYSEGLEGLLQAGWDGSLAMPFSTAIYSETDSSVGVAAPVAKKKSFACNLLDFNVGALLQPQTTEQRHGILHRFSAATDYAKLPPRFWGELVKGNHVNAFLQSSLMNQINMERWAAIVAGFASVGLSEEDIFRNHHKAVLELFHSKMIEISPSSRLQSDKIVSHKAAVYVLSNLVKAKGRSEVLGILKGFTHEFGINLLAEKGAKETQTSTAREVFNIFETVGLVDPTWKEFGNILKITVGKEEECIKDLLDIAGRGGCISPWNLLQLPLEILKKYLGHPVLHNALLEGSEHIDPLESNTIFTPQEKLELRKYLYTLAHKRGKLANIKTSPRDAGEWFLELPASDREAIVTSPTFNARVAESLNFPAIYGSAAGQEEARRLLFPARAQAVDLIFRDPGYTPLSQTTLEWLNKLLQPYAGAAFEEFLRNPKRITIPAATMFVASNMQVPGDYSIEQLKEVTGALSSESVLVLSPAQIVATLKDSWRFRFKYSKDYQGSIRELLQARLQTVQAEVKAALDGDIATKQSLQDMLKDGAGSSMAAPMKAFIAFLVAD